MKVIVFFIVLIVSQFSHSQGYDDYEDGTLEDWTNTDLSTTMLTNEALVDPPYQYDLFFLQKECDGTNTAVGEMAIINNSEEWTGTYPTGFFDAFAGLEMNVKNDNAFDLHLRIGYRGGSDNTKIVTNQSVIVPALSDWTWVDFFSIGDFTVIEGSNTWEEVFEDSHEAKIIHNDVLSYDGKVENGILKISWQSSIYLLSDEDQTLSKIKLFPNPAYDIVTLILPSTSEGYINLFNVLGENVLKKKLTTNTHQIDISGLKSGIYIARIEFNNTSLTKKIVKI